MAKELTAELQDAISDNRRVEGPVARSIEKQTAKLPSDLFLWGAAAVMATSLTLQFFRKKHTSLFIGQWAAPLLLFGIYNKIVKVAGHDQEDRGEEDENSF